MKLQKLFDTAAENARNIFNETGEVLPMWHVVTGNNENALIATPWGDEEDKHATIFALRQLFRQMKAKRYVMITEAWVATASTEREIRQGPPPSEHPDRREVLMINAEDRDGSSLIGLYYILRPEHGPAKLSPLTMRPFEETKGRMVNMLD